MADQGGGGGCCRCCFKFILTSGFTALFLWLSLRSSKPICSIQQFYLPALNKTSNSTTNTTIYFDLKLDNEMKDKGVYYDALNLTFYYGPNQSHPVGNATFDEFYQGLKKNARRRALVETHNVPWKAVFGAVSNGTAVFRVDLATAVRYKIMFWKTKRHRLVVGSTVEINDSGEKKFKKGIRLRSKAPELGCYRGPAANLLVVFTIVLILMFN